MPLFVFLIVGAYFMIVVSLYNLSCPHLSQWRFRQKGLCNKSQSEYYCVYDLNYKNNTEFCRKDISVEKDGYYVGVSGGITSEKCPRNLYQPFTFNTKGNTNCVMHKSQCNGIGQIVFDNGTTTTDRHCRCDYTAGYGFIQTPRHPCYCSPSEEDCACYLIECLNNTFLSPDYQCLPLYKWSDSFECPLKATSVNPEQTLELSTHRRDPHLPVITKSTIINVALTLGVLFLVGHVLYCAYLRQSLKEERVLRSDSTPKHILPGTNLGHTSEETHSFEETRSFSHQVINHHNTQVLAEVIYLKERSEIHFSNRFNDDNKDTDNFRRESEILCTKCIEQRNYFVVASAFYEVVWPILRSQLKNKCDEMGFVNLQDFLNKETTIRTMEDFCPFKTNCCQEIRTYYDHESLTLNLSQWNKLYYKSTNKGFIANNVSIDQLDILSLGIILITSCNLNMQKANAIRTICIFKNNYLSDNTKQQMKTTEFDTVWKDLVSYICDIDETKEQLLVEIGERTLDRSLCTQYCISLLDFLQSCKEHCNDEKIKRNEGLCNENA